MLFDSHVHSYASPDSHMDPAEAIFILRGKNMGVTFTEHVDYVTPVDKADPGTADAPRDERDYLADILIYPSRYEKYRADDVLLGLEMSLTKAFAHLNEQTVKEYDYDFIIGSVHLVDGYDIYFDYFDQPRYEDHYRRYLTYSREVVAVSGYFDSFGHIDYISRVSPLTEKNVWYERYAEEYDALLGLLAERDTALEINTRRLGDASAVNCWLGICKRFNELGGKFVTAGSDAHDKPQLGINFDKAKQIAEEEAADKYTEPGQILDMMA